MARSCSPERRHQTWSSSSSITCSTALVCPDESSTITGPNSPVKHFRSSAINLESKVSSMTCYPTANGLAEAFNKTIEKLLKKFVSKSQRDWDDKLVWMPMGLPHKCENPNESHVVFLGVRMWSCTPIGDSGPISASCLDNRDGRQGKALIAPPGVESFRRVCKPTANRALSNSDF